MKTLPQIGSDYAGPDLSRPAIRQLPHHWTIHTSTDPWFRVACTWLANIVADVLGRR